jgi:hypothetical protein
MFLIKSYRFRKYGVKENELKIYADKYGIPLAFLEELFKISKGLILEPVNMDTENGNKEVLVEGLLRIIPSKSSDLVPELAAKYGLNLYKTDEYFVTKLSEKEVIDTFAMYSDFIKEIQTEIEKYRDELQFKLYSISEKVISYNFNNINNEADAQKILDICKLINTHIPNTLLLVNNKAVNDTEFKKSISNHEPITFFLED